jgi:hypothetical protein
VPAHGATRRASAGLRVADREPVAISATCQS